MQEVEKILEEIEGEENKVLSRLQVEVSQRSIDEIREYVNGIRYAKDIIRKHMSGKDANVPTNDGWIPLTEENMPDVGDDILLTVEVNGHRITGKGLRYTTDSWLMDGQKITADAIKAWMLMPEPYEGNV